MYIVKNIKTGLYYKKKKWQEPVWTKNKIEAFIFSTKKGIQNCFNTTYCSTAVDSSKLKIYLIKDIIIQEI